MALKHVASTIAAMAVFAIASRARADETSSARRAEAAREQDRPYTLAEVSAGFITLPAAQVCPSSLDQCKQGESSLALGITNMFRFQRFGVGVGIQWATTLRKDAARGDASFERQHSRRYFLVEAKGRYALVRTGAWEVYAGPSLGAVIVNDSWSEKADRSPYADTDIVGPRAATIGTEGFTFGVFGGAEWSFSGNWVLGGVLRYANWILPTTREQSPTYDTASLSGRLDMFDVGLSIGYRIAL